MPVADPTWGQALVRMARGYNREDRVENIQPVRFVPLIGAEGWPDQAAWLANKGVMDPRSRRLEGHR